MMQSTVAKTSSNGLVAWVYPDVGMLVVYDHGSTPPKVWRYDGFTPEILQEIRDEGLVRLGYPLGPSPGIGMRLIHVPVTPHFFLLEQELRQLHSTAAAALAA